MQTIRIHAVKPTTLSPLSACPVYEAPASEARPDNLLPEPVGIPAPAAPLAAGASFILPPPPPVAEGALTLTAPPRRWSDELPFFALRQWFRWIRLTWGIRA